MIERIFDYGQYAYEHGAELDECPYPPHTHEAQEWGKGWDQARADCATRAARHRERLRRKAA
jgi:ribosome modulation factor